MQPVKRIGVDLVYLVIVKREAGDLVEPPEGAVLHDGDVVLAEIDMIQLSQLPAGNGIAVTAVPVKTENLFKTFADFANGFKYFHKLLFFNVGPEIVSKGHETPPWGWVHYKVNIYRKAMVGTSCMLLLERTRCLREPAREERLLGMRLDSSAGFTLYYCAVLPPLQQTSN